MRFLAKVQKNTLSLAIFSVLVSLFIMGATWSQSTEAAPKEKVTICHATGSVSNPYVKNQPDESADVGGHDGHADDIIPPFDYDGGSYPGKNWDATGQAIWNNNCNVPTPTATPTPTPTATPTATPTSTPTPTATPTATPIPTATPTPTATPPSTPNGNGGDNDPTPTPTPTATPTPTTTPTTTPNGQGGNGDDEADCCPGPDPVDPTTAPAAAKASRVAAATTKQADPATLVSLPSTGFNPLSLLSVVATGAAFSLRRYFN